MARTKTFRGDFDFRTLKTVSSPYGTPVETIRGSYPHGSELGSFVSTKTPNFRNLKKSQLPINPHYANCDLVLWGPHRYIEFNQWDHNSDIKYINYKSDYGSYQSKCPMMDMSLLSDLDNQLRLKIKSKKVDLAVMGGEMRQTASFLDKRVGNFIRFLNKRLIGQEIAGALFGRPGSNARNNKRGPLRFRAPKILSSRKHSFKVSQVPYKTDINGKWIKNPYYTDPQHQRMSGHLANTWLEYSYAVRPLLNDIYGAAEAIANVPYAVPLGVAKVTLKLNADFSVLSYSGSVLGNWRSLGQHSLSREIGVRYFRKNPLSALASLGLTNPLSLAWELVTLSFVVDWFLPIGRTLDSLDATVGTDFLDGFMTTTSKASSESSLKYYSAYYDADFNISMRRESFQRVRLTAFPGVTLPSFRWPGSLSQAASGVALIHQLFKR